MNTLSFAAVAAALWLLLLEVPAYIRKGRRKR